MGLTCLELSAKAQRFVEHELTRPDGYRTLERHTSTHRLVLGAPDNWLLLMGLHGNRHNQWGNFAEARQIKLLRMMISQILAMNMKSTEKSNPSGEMARDVRAVPEVPRLGDLFSEVEGVTRRLVAMKPPHGWNSIHPDVRASLAKTCDRARAADGSIARA